MEDKKMELQNWMLLRDSSDDLLEELDARIDSVKKELKKTRKKDRKEELKGVLNMYNAIRQQITENAYASGGQIRTLQESIRKDIKAEQIELYRKKNKGENS